MKLARVGPPDVEVPVVVRGDGHPADLAGVVDDIDPAVPAGDGVDRARAVVAAGGPRTQRQTVGAA